MRQNEQNPSIVDWSSGPIVDVYAEASSQQHPLGTLYTPDGARYYRYTLNGAVALTAGKLTQMVIIEANGDVTDMAVDTPAVGAKQLEATNGGNTAVTADEFAGGWLHVNDATGEGHVYRIRGNDAMATSTAGTVFLYDAIKVALVAASTASLTHSKYWKVIVHPSPATAQLVGVSPIAVTANYYFWCQTRGPACVLEDSSSTTIVQGYPVRASEDDDGAVALVNWDESGRNERSVGIVMHVNADGEHCLVDLQLE
jgi:hypothetical protein